MVELDMGRDADRFIGVAARSCQGRLITRYHVQERHTILEGGIIPRVSQKCSLSVYSSNAASGSFHSAKIHIEDKRLLVPNLRILS